LFNNRVEFAVFQSLENQDFEQIKKFCILAEDLGYSAFTVTDHFQNMGNPDGDINHPLEAWTVLGGLASVTSKIKLGTLVSCAHYRHPTVLAKMATTVDIISGGRTIFGIGAGWHQQEFEGFLGEFPSPKKRVDGLEDALNIAKSMFVNGRTNYAGKVYSARNTLNSPLPVQRPIPILVGGGGLKRTLRFAAKYADISHFGFSSMGDEAINQRLIALKEHCGSIGRDYKDLIKSISLNVNFHPSQADIEGSARMMVAHRGVPIEEARKMVVKEKIFLDPEETIKKVRGYLDMDITMFINVFRNEDDLKHFAEIMKNV
jgi:alkanesulfonate monooxygenase SsuD/methylene tetrahydromethanopterin reductase-like flavin-dependent oxidoreductase (luciferase family)